MVCKVGQRDDVGRISFEYFHNRTVAVPPIRQIIIYHILASYFLLIKFE